MNSSKQIAKHIRDVHFGGNWTAVSLKEKLADVGWKAAISKTSSKHSIAELVFHMNYYVSAVLPVFDGKALDAHDKFSFDVPEIECQQDWDGLLNRVWSEAEALATKVESLPDEKLCEDFSESKYGSYFRNLFGIVEHLHYHLGQISIIKTLVTDS